jgi:uncharacterized membrane protein
MFFYYCFLHFIITFDFCLDLWGMDENGNFREVAASRSTLGKIKKSLFAQFLLSQKEENTIGDLVLTELENVEVAIKAEKEIFTKERLTEREKGKRLLFLFQKDLMPGINGMILESKDKRDALVINGSSRTAKMVSWAFLILVNTGMLFYILLFALSQDPHRQNAWGQSFALWLVVEVFLVSTVSVLLMQVLIPSLTMKDVGIIKKKLIFNVISFYKDLAAKKNHGTEEKEGVTVELKNKVFNSAEYLFISTRLAHFYSDLRIAKMILAFQTPWPKQSYHHITDTSKKYDRKFSALQRSLSIVVLFFLTSLISVPISVQDMIIQCGSTVTIGYTLLFHLKLYQIFPVLIVVPTIFLGIIIHFMIQSNKAKKKVDDSKLMKEIKTMETERKNAYEATREDDKNNTKEATPLEAAIIVSSEHEQEEGTGGLMKHKKRRESLHKGIKLAQQIETVLQKVKEKKEQAVDDENSDTQSDAFLSSNESSSILAKYQKNVDESYATEEKESNDNSFQAFSPRTAFAYLAQRFAAEVDDSRDSGNYSSSHDEEDEDLFNLHLAKSKYSSDNEEDDDEEEDDDISSDDSLLHELKTQASMKLVSLSNTSLASRLLLDQSGFERRRKSYEKPSLIKHTTEEEEDEEEQEVDNDNDLPALNIFNRSTPLSKPSIFQNEGMQRRDNDWSSITYSQREKESISDEGKEDHHDQEEEEDMDDNLSSIHLPPLQHQNSKNSNGNKVDGQPFIFNNPLRHASYNLQIPKSILPSSKLIQDSNESSSEANEVEDHEKDSSSSESTSKKKEKDDHSSESHSSSEYQTSNHNYAVREKGSVSSSSNDEDEDHDQKSNSSQSTSKKDNNDHQEENHHSQPFIFNNPLRHASYNLQIPKSILPSSKIIQDSPNESSSEEENEDEDQEHDSSSSQSASKKKQKDDLSSESHSSSEYQTSNQNYSGSQKGSVSSSSNDEDEDDNDNNEEEDDDIHSHESFPDQIV